MIREQLLGVQPVIITQSGIFWFNYLFLFTYLNRFVYF